MPTALNDNEKRSLIEQRLKAFAIDAYGHELNRQIAIESDDTEGVLAADTALGQIAVATATYQQELAVLAPASDPVVSGDSEIPV